MVYFSDGLEPPLDLADHLLQFVMLPAYHFVEGFDKSILHSPPLLLYCLPTHTWFYLGKVKSCF